jgi:hypothetical protein
MIQKSLLKSQPYILRNHLNKKSLDQKLYPKPISRKSKLVAKLPLQNPRQTQSLINNQNETVIFRNHSKLKTLKLKVKFKLPDQIKINMSLVYRCLLLSHHLP